jgi:hypothetical protein
MTLRSLSSRPLPCRLPQQGHFCPLVQRRNGGDPVFFDLLLAMPNCWGTDALLAPSPSRSLFVEGLRQTLGPRDGIDCR